MEDIIYNILKDIYGEKKAKQKLPRQTQIRKSVFTLAKLLSIYDVDTAKKMFVQKVEKDRKKGTLSGYIERYGNEIGKIKYAEKNSRLSVSESALRSNGKTEDEIREIKTKHSSKSGHTLSNYISQYGEEIGKEKYDERSATHRTRSVRCVEFFLSRGFTRDESIQLVGDHQRRDYDFFKNRGKSLEEYAEYCKRKTKQWTLESYIERYGAIDGEIQYHYNKIKGSDINYFKQKHGIIAGQEKYDNMLMRKSSLGARDSNIQKTFAKMLYDSLSTECASCFYGAPISNAYWINYNSNPFNIKCSLPDVRIKNILIEFDGTYWHSRPAVVERDAMKDALNTQLGFLTMRIPEDDFIKDAKYVVNLATKFVNDNINMDFKRNDK